MTERQFQSPAVQAGFAELAIDAAALAAEEICDAESEPLEVRIERAAQFAYRGDRTLYRATKRALDVALSLFLICVSTPLMLALALCIKLDSPGPVVFRQARVARGGRVFTFYKFRTMFVDARERFPDYYQYKYAPDQVKTLYFKLAEDPRVTRFGGVLRRTSLDELPNLLNVLRGDMSIVGPRPEIPEMVPYYSERQLAKFWPRPGLTGLSQVTGRNILTFHEIAERDLEYVSNRSLGYDLAILARTPVAVVKMIGAL